jgi:hypothetical protein
MMQFELVRYNKQKAHEWNHFIKEAWNGVFLFDRGFMDYHAERFADHSLMAYTNGKLKAIFPANEKEGVLWSHQGLTYGGWVLSNRFSAIDLQDLFKELETYASQQAFQSIEYKHKPFVFEKHANDADAWVLWKSGYELWRRDLSFYLDLKNHGGFARDKRYRFNKSARNNLRLDTKGDVHKYMALVNHNLVSKYQTSAVHSPEEVLLLQKRFPNNCQTITVYQEERFLGGAWLFIDNDFIHTQYFHFNEEGRDLCAAEFLIGHLMEEYGTTKRYLNFGTSTDNNGQELNVGLASFKEGFGAAGFCHDFYRKELCR